MRAARAIPCSPMRIPLFLALFLTACASPEGRRVNSKGLPLVTSDGRDMVEIPAGEFIFGEQLLYLPAFLIDHLRWTSTRTRIECPSGRAVRRNGECGDRVCPPATARPYSSRMLPRSC